MRRHASQRAFAQTVASRKAVVVPVVNGVRRKQRRRRRQHNAMHQIQAVNALVRPVKITMPAVVIDALPRIQIQRRIDRAALKNRHQTRRAVGRLNLGNITQARKQLARRVIVRSQRNTEARIQNDKVNMIDKRRVQRQTMRVINRAAPEPNRNRTVAARLTRKRRHQRHARIRRKRRRMQNRHHADARRVLLRARLNIIRQCQCYRSQHARKFRRDCLRRRRPSQCVFHFYHRR